MSLIMPGAPDRPLNPFRRNSDTFFDLRFHLIRQLPYA